MVLACLCVRYCIPVSLGSNGNHSTISENLSIEFEHFKMGTNEHTVIVDSPIFEQSEIIKNLHMRGWNPGWGVGVGPRCIIPHCIILLVTSSPGCVVMSLGRLGSLWGWWVASRTYLGPKRRWTLFGLFGLLLLVLH